MKTHIHRIILGVLLYSLVCVMANLALKPYSIIHFIGPAAAVASALAIVWRGLGLVCTLLGIFLFYSIQIYLFHYEFELSIFLISSLAIFLQAYWAKQLTYKRVKKQKWLDNRATLFKFLLSVGPLAGLISASAALMISVLEAEQFNYPPFYIFAISYSSSILVAIFSVPSLLFAYGKQKLKLSRRISLIVAAIFGVVAVGFLFQVLQQQHQNERHQIFNNTHKKITSAINIELYSINSQLNAVAALIKSSEYVSAPEFRSFSHHVFHENSSVQVIQWVPAVQQEHRAEFEKEASQELNIDFQLMEQTLLGDLVPTQIGNVYLPVKYIYPANVFEQMYGVNLWRSRLQKDTITRAVNLRKAVASTSFMLNYERQFQEGVLVYYPVYNANNAHGSLRVPKQSPVSGFVVAIVRFEPYLAELMLNFPDVNLYVEDMSSQSGVVIYGENMLEKHRLTYQDNIDVFTQNWQVNIEEKLAWSIQPKSWQTWGILVGATLGGMLFQLLFLMMAVYSIELEHRVTLKTRNLILSKDKAEKENQAKRQFMHTLSAELRTPFNVIKRLTETFPEKNMSEQSRSYLENITDASLNLEQLIDTVNELSNIESGLFTFNLRSFDFSIFISRMESMISVSPHLNGQKIKVVTSKDVPTFIDSDELRLQQLFMMLVENASEVLATNTFCISVNVHSHKLNNATLFLVLTPLHEDMIMSSMNALRDESNFTEMNTRMAMIHELCKLFGGDLKLAHLPSGNMMLSASVKIRLHQHKQENFGSNFIAPSIKKSQSKSVLLIQESNTHNDELCQRLLNEHYQVEVIDELDDVFNYLAYNHYDLLLFDSVSFTDNMIKMLRKIRHTEEYKNISIVGLVSTELTHDKIIIIQGYLDEYLFTPITNSRFIQLMNKHCV